MRIILSTDIGQETYSITENDGIFRLIKSEDRLDTVLYESGALDDIVSKYIEWLDEYIAATR